ncbi:hypothetical protein SAMD00019534_035550, partial [Acytostelium subglobosum LB1]|uniref:hypothetical protein n=1 Tax=Acytostelium subglobosum LB1 TaxID=1410327 RepID=UPI000644D4BF
MMIATQEEVVHFVSLGYGELRLAKKYATKQILERLFQTEGGLIMVDPNGDEVVPHPIVSDNNNNNLNNINNISFTRNVTINDDNNLDNDYDYGGSGSGASGSRSGSSSGSDELYEIDSSKTYTIVSEIDLLSDTEDDGDDDLDDEQDFENEHDCEHNHDDDDDEESVELECDDLADTNDSNADDIIKTTTQPEQADDQHEQSIIHSNHNHTHNHNNNHNNNHNHNHNDQCPDDCTDNGHQQQIQKLLRMREERINLIKTNYRPLHPELFTFTEDFLDEAFLGASREYSKTQDPASLFTAITKLTDTGIYSLKVFKEDFCLKLLNEIDNFRNSGLPTARPNSMNNYGVILDEIGFTSFFTQFRDQYLRPFTSVLYPRYNGAELDSHHAFIVQYKIDKDKELGFHYDESDVTLNLCLGRQFTGGSLYFRGILDQPDTHQEYFEFQHKPGTALLHVGSHRHGANGLTSGERSNLIMWLKKTSGNSNIY